MSRIYQSKPLTSSSSSSFSSNTNTNTNKNSHSTASAATAKTTSSVKLYHTENHSSSKANETSVPKQHEKMSSSHDFEKVIGRLESVATRLERVASAASSAGPAGAAANGQGAEEVNAPSVNAYVDILNGSFKQFIDYSTQIGSEVKTMGDMVKNLFNLEKCLLAEATRSAQPSNDVFMKALQPLSKQIEEIQAFREKNRKSELFNHLSGVSESIGALGWVTVQPAPCPYIKEMCDAGQFYTNRVLKEFKEKDPSKLHSNWVQSWIRVLNELQAYVKQYHTTGLTWNPRGGALNTSRISPSAAPAPGPSAGGAPPPPPPPSYDIMADNPSKPASNNLHAMLAKELNVGTDITKGLKKVTDDQKTHKNTSLRAGSMVPGSATSSSSASHAKQAPSAAPNKPPRFELVDKKWFIEYQNGQHNLCVSNPELKQTVYIYKCKDCTVQVKGKVNSIQLDLCDRVGVLFDDVLATLEFVNSKNVQAQVTGKVPTISIDKTDGCQLYLSKQALGVEIVSSKSSAMNVLVPTEQDGDYVEHPLPEQFKTTLKNNKPFTVPTETA